MRMYIWRIDTSKYGHLSCEKCSRDNAALSGVISRRVMDDANTDGLHGRSLAGHLLFGEGKGEILCKKCLGKRKGTR